MINSKKLLPEDIDLLINKEVLFVPSCKGSVVLDGKCSGIAWESAARVLGWKSHDKLSCRTEALLTWNSEKLYVGFICEEPSTDKLRYGQTVGIRSRDIVPVLNMHYHRPQYCEDDTVEIFLDAKNDSFSYDHILVNPVGDAFTSRGWASRTKLQSDYNWRLDNLQSNSVIGSSKWSSTIAIPFSSLGLKNVAAGQVMGLNLKRERQAGDKPESYYWQTETLAWSTQLSTQQVYQPEIFNKIVLGNFSDNLKYFETRIKNDYELNAEDKKKLTTIVSVVCNDQKQWRQQLQNMHDLVEQLYSRSFVHKWWVFSKEPAFEQMTAGLVNMPRRPAPYSSLPKKLEPVFIQSRSSQISLWATNLGVNSNVPKIVLVSDDKIFEPINSFSVKKGQTSRLDFKVEQGEYQLMIDGCVGPKLTVKQLDTLSLAVKQFCPPSKKMINGRGFWMMQRMNWNLPGICKLSFLEDNGWFAYTPKRYRLAVRNISVYEPKSRCDISWRSKVTTSFDCQNAGVVCNGSVENGLVSPISATPLAGWIQLNFDRVCRISKIEIAHGELCGGKVDGEKVKIINCANNFELQYRCGDKWETIPGTVEINNCNINTIHEFKSVVTNGIRLVIHSQSYSGIKYNNENAWKWFFEGNENLLSKYKNNHLSDDLKSQSKGESPLERQLDVAPFTLHTYRLSCADEIAAQRDPMFEVALKSLKRRFPKTFQGFWIAEWESDQLNALHGVLENPKWENHVGIIPPIPIDRHGALALMEKWYRLEQSFHLNEGFGMNCYRCGDHWHLAWGSKAGWIETTQSGNPSHRIQFAFLRGACRQFSKPMGLYAAVYLGPSAPDYLNPRKGAVDYTPTAGTSPSLYLRTLIYGYLSGIDMLACESQLQGHLVKVNKHYKLSPHGKALERFHSLTKKLEDRGTPYTPIGVVLPFDHGWYPAYMTGNSTGVAGGRVVGNGEPYKSADEATDAFFRTVFGDWTTQRMERHGNPFSHSKFGDIFDVIVLDPPKGSSSMSFLSYYPALILLGNYKFRPEHIKKLVNYARGGGLLIINEAHKSCFPEHKNIIMMGHKWHGSQKGKMDFEVIQFLQKLSYDLSPITVTGDIHYLINKTKKGWLVGLFNHKGVYKTPKESEVVLPEESSNVEISWKGEFVVKEVVENSHWSKLKSSIDITVPAGEVRVLILNSKQQQ